MKSTPHDATVRLLLQHGAGATSIEEDETNFQPAATPCCGSLSPARQQIVRRNDWSFVDFPAEWTVQHHQL